MHRLLLAAAVVTFVGCSTTPGQPLRPADETKASEADRVRRISVYVLPYYESAPTPEGRPHVAVAAAFDAQLASTKREDIVAVRDAIQAQPQLITPMTLMVLAIRLYDVGLRDDAVFWFYVATNRYLTLSDVLNVKSAELAQVEDAIRGFGALAGPFINNYAFCDLEKQQEARGKSVAWVEQNPYQALFMEQLPALPGDRTANLKSSIAALKMAAEKERHIFADPRNRETFEKVRRTSRVDVKFCWTN